MEDPRKASLCEAIRTTLFFRIPSVESVAEKLVMTIMVSSFAGVIPGNNAKERMMEVCKLYTLSTCSHCKSCKRFLGECGIEYEFTDVDLLPEADKTEVLDEIKRLSSRCAFPTIVIGEKVIVGFREQEIKQALGL
jgi:glutaredoxin-like protein NrdH